LYLDPPGEAVVLRVDEKTQVRALDRTQSLLPIDFGLTEKRTQTTSRMARPNLFIVSISLRVMSSPTALHAATAGRFSPFYVRPSNPMRVERSLWCWTTCPPAPPPR
jgi:hypothetical protein